MEAGKGGGIGVGQHHVDLLVFKIVAHIGGGGGLGQCDLVKIDERRGLLPPAGVARQLRLRELIRAGAGRDGLLRRAGLDDGDIQQERQTLIGFTRGDDERPVVRRVGGRDKAQA